MRESQQQSHAEFGSFSAAETVWADVKKKKKKQEEGWQGMNEYMIHIFNYLSDQLLPYLKK